MCSRVEKRKTKNKSLFLQGSFPSRDQDGLFLSFSNVDSALREALGLCFSTEGGNFGSSVLSRLFLSTTR